MLIALWHCVVPSRTCSWSSLSSNSRLLPPWPSQLCELMPHTAPTLRWADSPAPAACQRGALPPARLFWALLPASLDSPSASARASPRPL
ncbi:hypothetical protein G6F60_015365 [Rhizopus arrhizus]|nr:hypothetical protein G6F60_015365 [Rhizopus arrhizus]